MIYRKILLLLSIGLIIYPVSLTVKTYLEQENYRNSFIALYDWPLPISDCLKIIEIMKKKGLKDEDFKIYERPSNSFFDPGKGRYISIRRKYFTSIIGSIVEKGFKLHFINPIKILHGGYGNSHDDYYYFRSMNFLAGSLLEIPYIKKCSFIYLTEDITTTFENDAKNYPCAVVIVKASKPLPKAVMEGINQMFIAYSPDELIASGINRDVVIYDEKGSTLYGNPKLINSDDFLEDKKRFCKITLKFLTDRAIRPYSFYFDNTEFYICLSTFTSGIIISLILFLTRKRIAGEKK